MLPSAGERVGDERDVVLGEEACPVAGQDGAVRRDRQGERSAGIRASSGVADAAAKEAWSQDWLSAGQGEERLARAGGEEDVDRAARGIPGEVASFRASRLEAVRRGGVAAPREDQDEQAGRRRVGLPAGIRRRASGASSARGRGAGGRGR